MDNSAKFRTAVTNVTGDDNEWAKLLQALAVSMNNNSQEYIRSALEKMVPHIGHNQERLGVWNVGFQKCQNKLDTLESSIKRASKKDASNIFIPHALDRFVEALDEAKRSDVWQWMKAALQDSYAETAFLGERLADEISARLRILQEPGHSHLAIQIFPALTDTMFSRPTSFLCRLKRDDDHRQKIYSNFAHFYLHVGEIALERNMHPLAFQVAWKLDKISNDVSTPDLQSKVQDFLIKVARLENRLSPRNIQNISSRLLKQETPNDLTREAAQIFLGSISQHGIDEQFGLNSYKLKQAAIHANTEDVITACDKLLTHLQRQSAKRYVCDAILDDLLPEGDARSQSYIALALDTIDAKIESYPESDHSTVLNDAQAQIEMHLTADHELNKRLADMMVQNDIRQQEQENPPITNKDFLAAFSSKEEPNPEAPHPPPA